MENPLVDVWSREHGAPREAMSVRRIVEMALHIADAEGLDALSMRRIATDLQSGTTSLYRYVASRDELIDLMLDAAYGDDPLPGRTGDWRADLAVMARRRAPAAWPSTTATGRAGPRTRAARRG